MFVKKPVVLASSEQLAGVDGASHHPSIEGNHERSPCFLSEQHSLPEKDGRQPMLRKTDWAAGEDVASVGVIDIVQDA